MAPPRAKTSRTSPRGGLIRRGSRPIFFSSARGFRDLSFRLLKTIFARGRLCQKSLDLLFSTVPCAFYTGLALKPSASRPRHASIAVSRPFLVRFAPGSKFRVHIFDTQRDDREKNFGGGGEKFWTHFYFFTKIKKVCYGIANEAHLSTESGRGHRGRTFLCSTNSVGRKMDLLRIFEKNHWPVLEGDFL